MIVAQKWYCIAQTTSIGSSSGIKVEFGNYYRLLLNASVDWGNAVISIQFSNISKDIVASVRLRNNGQYFYLDIKLSKPFDTDFSTSLYDNSSWNLASSVSDLSGVPICIIDDINSLNTSQTGGESYFVEDENGDLHPIPKEDGTARGIYTDSFLSSGGKNTNAGGAGGGGITDLLIRFDNISPNPNGYQVVNGVITLPNYPVVPDISNYLTKSQADEAYYPLASGNALDSRLSVIEKAFDITIDENGIVQEIKANAGFWTEHYLSSGGKNEDSGSTGGLAQVTIRFDAQQIQEEYVSENGIIHLPAYPKLSDLDLSSYLTKLDAAELYYSKVKGNELETTVTGINNALTQFRTLFDSMFEIDEDGHIKAKKGLYTEQFLSSGGKNEDINSGGGITSFDIMFEGDNVSRYPLENGVVILPAYPTVEDIDLSPYLTRTDASRLYVSKDVYNTHTEDYSTFKSSMQTFKALFDEMFEKDADGHIHAKAGLYTDSFLSSGGKNTTEGTTGGGLTEFSVIFNGTQYDSSNGVATIDGTYATTDAVNDAIATSKSYTDTSIANLINGAPNTLDTLKEIADAMAANENVVDALEEAIGTKASQTELNTLSVRVTTAENDIKTLKTNVSTNAAAINTNKTAITTFQGYFTNGIAKEAAKVSNIFKITFNGTTYEYNGSAAKEINFSATNIVSALGTTPVNRAKGDESGDNIKTTYATKTALQEFIDKIEKYFTFGDDNIKANYGLWTDSYLSSGGQNSSAGGTGGIDIQAMWDALAASSNEQIHINHIPDLSSRYLKTSDVYDWAKAATKPTYTKSEVGLGNVDNTSDSNKIVKAVIDYNDAARTVYIGYAGTGLTATNATHLAAYSVLSDGRQVIKDISKDNVETWLGLGDLAYLSSISWNKITSDKPTTLAGYGITDKVAYREAVNNFMDYTNEFTFAAPAYSSYIWMNYRTASGSLDGAITEYRFAKGAGFSYADIRAAKYIVNSGTSSQFLKADGSLDGTSYLPLSGETMANNAGISWSYNVHSWNNAVDGFECISTTKDTFGYYSGISYKGYYGLQIRAYGGNTDRFEVRGRNASSWDTWRTLIHSGNIGSYAVKYLGGSKADDARHSLGLDNGSQGSVNLPSGGGFITMGHDSYGAQLLGSYVTGTLYFRPLNNNSWGTWKTVAFTDSNVASATKLQTARTLWGQSFDGTGIVNGSLFGVTNIFFEPTNTYGIYKGSSYSGALTADDIVIYAKKTILGEAGNVGIGTNTPTSTLHVNGSFRAGSSVLDSLTVNGSATFASGYRHLTRRGNTSYNSGWLYGTYGQEAMAFINNAAVSSFMFVQGKTAIENWNTDTWQSVRPALQIKQNCVAINYLWGQNVTPDYTLRVEGSSYFSGNISAGGDIIAFNSSDARLKDNITTISDDRAIDILSRLNPVTFAWNEIATSLSSRLQGDSQGFIAQEWEKIIPNASGTMWGKYKGIDYIQTIPYLTKGWQIHETKIQRLEREVKELKDKLAKYESIS